MQSSDLDHLRISLRQVWISNLRIAHTILGFSCAIIVVCKMHMYIIPVEQGINNRIPWMFIQRAEATVTSSYTVSEVIMTFP